MPTLDPRARDLLVREFRKQVYAKTGFVPFPHQAAWQAATEGYTLTDTVVDERDLHDLPPGCDTYLVQYTDPATIPSLASVIHEHRLAIPRRPGIAHHASLLAAYKSGKTEKMGMFATGFACVPDAVVQLVGIEYRTGEHEFNVIIDALLGEQGMNLRKRHLYLDARNGRLHLELTNGMVFEVKSWERREALKGAQILAYLYCEAYMLPGLESFTTVAQNLRAEQGYAFWGTTCDSPWLADLHDLGHGADADWHCTCGIPGWTNPHTFDLKAFVRDCPDPQLLRPYHQQYPWLQQLDPEGFRGLMTKERFAIAWLGQLGTYAGRVYDYQRGQQLIDPNKPEFARLFPQEDEHV